MAVVLTAGAAPPTTSHQLLVGDAALFARLEARRLVGQLELADVLGKFLFLQRLRWRCGVRG